MGVGVAALSVLLDAWLGEPPARAHPVVWMGRYLGLKDRLLRVSSRPLPRFTLGAGFVLVGALGCGVAAWALTRVLARLPWFAETALLAALLKPLFSVKALLEAGGVVQEALEHGDLPEARRLLAWHLVSRETAELSEGDVAGGAVSSLAENLTDSIVAPLFYFALFGLPGAAVYRFINTADATLGYRTADLEHLGKFAARADDLLSYLPARLAAALLALALAFSGKNVRTALKGMFRDQTLTPSPNGGVTMALAAAGLGVRLEKRGVYVLNSAGRTPTAANIGATRRLLRTTVVLGLGCYAALWGLNRA